MEAILRFEADHTEIETADKPLIKNLRLLSLSHFDEIRLTEFDGTYETWSVPVNWLKIVIEPPKRDDA